MKTLLLPVHLSHFHPFHPVYSVSDMRFVTSLFIDIITIYIFYRAGKKNHLFFIAIILVIVPLLPVLSVPVLGRSVFAERYLYLPSAGFALLLTLSIAYVSQYLFRKKTTMMYGFLTAAVCVLAVYSTGVLTRGFDWKDDYTLWQSTLRRYPESYFAYYKLGKFYLKKGAFDDAIEAFNRSINLNVSRPRTDSFILELAQMRLNKAHAQSGMLDEKIVHYQKVIEVFPGRLDAYLYLGKIYVKKGRIGEAISLFKKALQKTDDPSALVEIHKNLGMAYERKGLLQGAIDSYERVLTINPDDEFARKKLEEYQ
jgi:tetratricopeptide (TPR) repeat protein